MPKRGDFVIAGHSVAPGTRATVELPVAVMSDHTPVTMSVHVVHGRRPGPVIFVSAAIHGDEVIGVEIVRRLLKLRQLGSIAGTILAVPIVNTFGFLNHSRYLPDRRDLNRSFPGSAGGSLAARLAHLFLTEVVMRSDIGIDLHSAAIHRMNLPQIRIAGQDEQLMELAETFGAPVILTSGLRDGSLRAEAAKRGRPILLYEAGEGLRFDEMGARAGMRGILRVMHKIGMVGSRGVSKPRSAPLRCRKSEWLRAPRGGLLRAFRTTGDIVGEGDVIAAVADPFGTVESEILAPRKGIIVGRANMPVVNEGDAIFHLAEMQSIARAESAMEQYSAQLEADPLFDEDEII
ncbi:succinylglutamate desuccinylase/aspartoacylase family protein [Tropicimonas sp. IMCC34011]|uniref:succinylglutamate desuccinylase/aspartoacylase family protein n=1 Tax=Tropicimonas sp. IMCC34011 TaxID=2248759 RepID=UPI000E2742CA|nr:succinylglutamate desuccinylase/aspartoacylase family protein [Tropicimonas sp. IMCC34011]